MEDLKDSGSDILEEYNTLLTAYLDQNLKELEMLVEKEEGFDKMEAKLLTDRNDRWIKKMEEQLTKNATFFAVGAMHLVGEKGLIEQLQAAGYSVEAVN